MAKVCRFIGGTNQDVTSEQVEAAVSLAENFELNVNCIDGVFTNCFNSMKRILLPNAEGLQTSQRTEEELLSFVRDARPDVLWVCLGSGDIALLAEPDQAMASSLAFELFQVLQRVAATTRCILVDAVIPRETALKGTAEIFSWNANMFNSTLRALISDHSRMVFNKCKGFSGSAYEWTVDGFQPNNMDGSLRKYFRNVRLLLLRNKSKFLVD